MKLEPSNIEIIVLASLFVMILLLCVIKFGARKKSPEIEVPEEIETPQKIQTAEELLSEVQEIKESTLSDKTFKHEDHDMILLDAIDVKKSVRELKELLEQGEFSSRCSDYVEGCADCEFWKKFDKIFGPKLSGGDKR